MPLLPLAVCELDSAETTDIEPNLSNPENPGISPLKRPYKAPNNTRVSFFPPTPQNRALAALAQAFLDLAVTELLLHRGELSLFFLRPN